MDRKKLSGAQFKKRRKELKQRLEDTNMKISDFVSITVLMSIPKNLKNNNENKTDFLLVNEVEMEVDIVESSVSVSSVSQELSHISIQNIETVNSFNVNLSSDKSENFQSHPCTSVSPSIVASSSIIVEPSSPIIISDTNEISENSAIARQTEVEITVIAENSPISESNVTQENPTVLTHIDYDFSDPARWPNLSSDIIQTIVEKGLHQIRESEFTFPVTKNRKFSSKHYNREIANGTFVRRTWLIYSKIKDAVFCFPCKLFGKLIPIGLVSSGFSNWNHISQMLKEHECSIKHIENVKKWKTL